MLLLHRYAGLTMTLFLVIVGLTGSVLTFYRELDAWLNPQLLTVTPQDRETLDPLKLRDQLLAADPRLRIDYVALDQTPNQALDFAVQPQFDPRTQSEYSLCFTDIYLNPYDGSQLGRREWGAASLTRENLMPFLYRLHYSLALPSWIDRLAPGRSVGGYVLGAVALLWTLDCFVGFYLTLPRRRSATSAAPRSWWQRWRPAWRVKPARLNYDLHRAAALWLWPMLLVFAWSSVSFNLTEVYSPVMHAAFAFRGDLPARSTPLDAPAISFMQARDVGRQALRILGEQNGFSIEHEDQISLDRDRGLYAYIVRSSADAGRWGTTTALIDADSGVVRDVQWPGNEQTGDSVGRWLTMLHMASVFGTPMRLLVGLLGLTIAMLSVTGVLIWRRKVLLADVAERSRRWR